MTKALTFWLLAVVLLTSCDVFLTRDPDPPSESSSSYIPPVIDSLVFVNLANALRETNTLNYLRTFADSSSSGRNFRFEPSTQALSRYGGVFSSWTKHSEQQYFENMKSKLQTGSAPILEFLTLTPQSRQSDSSQYNATYRLTTQHSQANVAKQVRGQSQFFLMTDRSKNWVIWRWVDIAQSSADSTWSDLKGGFGQ
ncbi:MAG: hypothetical protein HYY49_14355 [Ignavibacteriales bacterium]|nr:hypothetical protein [Ignavibacteriales bacterium]